LNEIASGFAHCLLLPASILAAELLQHAEIVPVCPALYDLAVSNPEDLDGRRLDLLPGGCSAHEPACIRPYEDVHFDCQYIIRSGIHNWPGLSSDASQHFSI
jgi:hypothetical protein